MLNNLEDNWLRRLKNCDYLSRQSVRALRNKEKSRPMPKNNQSGEPPVTFPLLGFS